MIILDENYPEDQRELLLRWRFHVRQIGIELGRTGMSDETIVSLLHGLDRPTLFSLDRDFRDRDLRHQRYCLVYQDIRPITCAACYVTPS